jgi:hypothetical protein
MRGFLSLFLIHNVESKNYGISFILRIKSQDFLCAFNASVFLSFHVVTFPKLIKRLPFSLASMLTFSMFRVSFQFRADLSQIKEL